MGHGKLSYSEKAIQVARLVDLAEEIIEQTERLSPTDREHLIQFGRDAKKIALDPNPPFKRISSLKLMESDLLTYWEDILDEEINLLWTKIQ